MDHLRPIILALLLAVAGPAAAISSSAPSIQSSVTMATADNQVYEPANTSAVLTLGEDADETRAFTTVSLDVGTSLNLQKQSLDHQLESRAFATQFEQADSREDKRDLLLKYATRVDTQTLALESREAAARRGFQNGSISAAEYVTTLIFVNAEADHILTEIDAAENYASGINDFSLARYFGTYQKRLMSLRSPIREDLARKIQSNSPSNRYYLSVAQNGIIVSFINDGTYHRDIYREDHRDLDDNNRYNSSAISDRRDFFYSWASPDGENFQGSGLNPNAIGGYTYFSLEHTHGLISGRFDQSTGLVFQESQRKYLTSDAASRNGLESTRPKGPGETANESGLLLTVNRSYAGGPMYVALQDNETGEFVEGTVAIDNETVGKTTTDGGLWTLSPAGSFNVSASSRLDVVTVETRATRPITSRNATQG